jgi:hypothetical protein
MDSIPTLFDRFTTFFWELPRGAHVATFVVLGITLTGLAVPKFEDEIVTGIFYMALAVFFFWWAITLFM